MSDGKRFWTRVVYADGRQDFVKSNYVTTRERGVIPGCVPAVDVLVEMTDEEVKEAIMNDPYGKVWDDYRHGIIGWNEWLNHAIHKRPQRSFVRNPATATKRNYFAS